MGAKALLADVLYGSKLAVQSVGLVTQAAVQRQRAKGTFRRTLIQQGVPSDAANEIAKDFPNPVSDLFSVLKAARLMKDEET